MILKRSNILFCSLILSVLLCGCGMVTRYQNQNDLLNWKYGDLRLLDNVDATLPYQDLIAVYTREINHNFQIRLDFLKLEQFLGKDIFIALDTNPGGKPQINTVSHGSFDSEINWDYLLEITNSGIVDLMDNLYVPVKNTELFIIYDSDQDRIVISMNSVNIPIIFGQTKLQVIITPPDQTIIADQSEIFTTDTPSPSRIKLLFAFWNTFTAETPAQTLRAWAGAHSGPMSSRHGLGYLLEAASVTKTPVLLIDLSAPDSWSALDYIGELFEVQKLIDQGIILIPDMEKLVVSNANINSALYLFVNDLIRYSYYNSYSGGNDYAQSDYTNHNCNLAVFSNQNTPQAENLSLQCKEFFISSLFINPSAPLILGGDFSQSVLGNPATALELFTYIQAHPWIQAISKNDFLVTNDFSFLSSSPKIKSMQYFSSQSRQVYTKGMNPVEDKIYAALLESPKNQLTSMAWKVFADLTQPASVNLMNLRSTYMGQIGNILAAAEWAQNPYRQSSCNVDLDYDGSAECILATTNFMAIIEPVGGYISFIFSKDTSGVHQLIGPTWEFAVGLSDASTWKAEMGVLADSGQMLGAFQDPVDDWNTYQPKIIDNHLVLSGDNSVFLKTLSVSADSLQISISKPDISPTTDLIPLVIDPWLRYQPNWGDLYFKNLEQNDLSWGITSGEKVSVRSSNQLEFYAFNDSHHAFAYPEDPNFDYGKGHYLPFPMAVAEIRTSETYTVEIKLVP